MTDPATGRPIVAELGRPETAEEKTVRVAAARAKRRSNQSTKNLVLSLVASLAIVLFLVLVAVQTEPETPAVDFEATAQEAADGLNRQVIAPVISDEWTATRAELTATLGIAEWRSIFVTNGDPNGSITMVQGFDAETTWLSEVLRLASLEGDEVTIGDRSWTLYDRRGTENLGLRQYGLVTETPDSIVVLYGSATEDEFALLATAISDDLTQP